MRVSWFILGALCLCGTILLIVPDRRVTETLPFIDRSRLRHAGGTLLGISATILIGLVVLSVLGNWVASDL